MKPLSTGHGRNCIMIAVMSQAALFLRTLEPCNYSKLSWYGPRLCLNDDAQ